MSNPVLQVGFLGAGYIADWHAKALRHVKGTRLAAVCDVSMSRAQAFADTWNVDGVYSSIDEFIRRARLDAVHVLLPPQHHAGAARQLLTAGLNVLLEKPMAIAAEDCENLALLAREKNVLLGVSHNFLFAAPYEQLRHDVKAGRLGRIDHVSITWNKELGFIKSGPFDHWAVREPGNAMLEVGAHSAAHLVDLVGAPDHAQMRVQVSRPVELPTGAVAYRRWHVYAQHGDVAAELNFSLAPGYPEHVIHVRGTLGAATCDFEANTYVLRRDSRYSLDLNRFRTARAAGTGIARQAWGNLLRYGMGKAKLLRGGNAFEASIAGSLKAYYAALRSDGVLDPRIGSEMGADVVRVARMIADEAPKRAATVREVAPRPARHATTLVTGGTGFIGRELVKQLLARGERVRVMTRQTGVLPFDFDTTHLDVMTGNILADSDQEKALKGIDVVYHLARGSGKTYGDYLKDDVDPTRRLAEKATAAGVKRFIYTSSIVVLNWADHRQAIRDDATVDRAIHRRAAYTRAKGENERVLTAMQNEKGLPLVIVRPGIVVGPGSDPCHWGVGMWQSPGVCQVWGDGKNPLPFVLVEDVAAGMILAQDEPAAVGKSFNLVDEPMLSARDYLAEFERAGGIELQKLYTPTWRFFAADLLKYFVKVVVRHPGRTRPSWRDWNARRELSRYDTAIARLVLGWKPAGNRATLVERGVHEPVRRWLEIGAEMETPASVIGRITPSRVNDFKTPGVSDQSVAVAK